MCLSIQVFAFTGECKNGAQVDHLSAGNTRTISHEANFPSIEHLLHKNTHTHTSCVLKVEAFNCVATSAADNLPGGKLTFPQLLPVLESYLRKCAIVENGMEMV